MSTFVIYSMVWWWQLPAGHRTWRQTVQINWAVPLHPGKVSGCDALLSATCTARLSGRSLRFVNGRFVRTDAACGPEAQKNRICSHQLPKMNGNEEAQCRQPCGQNTLSQEAILCLVSWLGMSQVQRVSAPLERRCESSSAEPAG